MTEKSPCRWDRKAETHLLREHLPECADRECKGCRPCTHDADGNPVRHCRTRRRCNSHLDWHEHACPGCLAKIRALLTRTVDLLAVMPAEAQEQGLNSEAANLAGPHADYVRSQWRLVNADRAGQTVEELDLLDPYTCLTMHERFIREDLGHDEITLVSPTVAQAASYLEWVLTDLARDPERGHHLTSLMSNGNALVDHLEAARRNSHAPERGAPCPECVEAEKDPPRLLRTYGHWCWREGCTKDHYLDDSGDTWRCPECGASWTHEQYENYVRERRRTA